MAVRHSTVLILSALLVGTSQAQRVDRYYTDFHIADLTMTTMGVDGGVGGFTTDPVPIYAQAVVNVEEGQRFTWEWVGLTEPGLMTVPNFPHITFEATSDDTFEYRDAVVDLNPIAPNTWGSGDIVQLAYDPLRFDIHYESFSFTNDVKAVFDPSRDPNTAGTIGFYPVISSLDYREFPQKMNATITLNTHGGLGWIGAGVCGWRRYDPRRASGDANFD